MHLQYLSDLHLEFPDNRLWLRQNPITPIGDVLVVAGDTHHLGPAFKKLDFWDFCAANFERTYVIPGNHEYYGGYDLGNNALSFREELRGNVILLNNHTEEYNGIRLVFSTMWSRIDHRVMDVFRGLYDFRVIRYCGRNLTVNDFNEVHEQCWAFLEKEIIEPGPKVVVTHHLPSEQCNAPAFQGSALNEGFCVDKTRFIENNDIAAWVYGHSHRNVGDVEIGDTWLLTNQLGYIGYGEQKGFSDHKAVRVVLNP
ncbi:metallophosphoesterase [Neolewinella aurantiaca]|nr:metallophosphoesterase [Neolewinella aurantiaca]